MMRDTPRVLPFRVKLRILTSGLFFFVGITILTSTYFVFRYLIKDLQNTQIQIAGIVLLIWGLSLIIYSLIRNYRRLSLLIWGRMYFAELVKREKSFVDFVGTVFHECHFTIVHEGKGYDISLDIPDPFDLEEESHYILFYKQQNPVQVVCLHQFSKSVMRFFIESHYSNIQLGKKEQGLT